MRKEKRKIHWIWFVFPIAVIVASLIFVSALFFNCISDYSNFDISYNDFTYEELTFNGYKTYKRSVGRFTNDMVYEIQFEEYGKSFVVDGIADRKLNKTALEELEKGEILKVYHEPTKFKEYKHQICVLSSDSITLLSLSDYIETHKNNLVLGMIFFLFVFLCCLYVLWLFVRKYIPINKKKKSKSNSGKMKIEYSINGDVIRIYKSKKGYSLVINEKTADQCSDTSSNDFSLKGKVRFYGNDIPVEAKRDGINICLYYDSKLVAKKFK